MSSHLYPEVSAHLLAVDAHRPQSGAVVAAERPGVGLSRDEDAVGHYRVG